MINYKYNINIYIEVQDRKATEVNSGAVTSIGRRRVLRTQPDGWTVKQQWKYLSRKE